MHFQILESFEDDAISVAGFAGTGELITPEGGTSFLVLSYGNAWIETHWLLFPGMYACVEPDTSIYALDARLMLVTAKGYAGMLTIGGPVEAVGRLRYIDGCSDTGLIPPPRLGDPCLNFLHFPPCVTQTAHTHPSHRVGMVMRGRGVCQHPGGSTRMDEGDIFLVPADSVHSFHTGASAMDIVAFHPDSVFGPTDERHQMLAATIPAKEGAMHGGG